MEGNDAVKRVSREKGIPLHSGNGCSTHGAATIMSSGAITCKRCRHFLAAEVLVYPHCDGKSTAAMRVGEDGNLPILHGLERITQVFPSTIAGGISYWACRLKELLAMVDSPALGRPGLFITNTYHEGSDGMKRLLHFLGCPGSRTATEWPKYQVEITWP